MTGQRAAADVPIDREALREQGLFPPGAIAAFAAGSYTAGWAHANSDIDVYVICERRPDLPSNSYNPLGNASVPPAIRFDPSGMRWDTEFWLQRQVDRILAKVATLDLEQEQAAGSDLTREEVDFLHRIAIGVPIVDPDWLERHQQLLARSAVRPILTSRAFNDADGFIEDAAGQLRSADYESAVLSGRHAFGLVVDGLLASCGELSPAGKWRARKFRRARPELLSFEEYWRVETMQGFDPAEPDVWVREVLELCQLIIGSVDIS